MIGELNFPDPVQNIQPPIVYVKEKVVWEYKQITRAITTEKAPDEAELNALGAEGWELAGVLAESSVVHFYFKRLAR